jgi:hypothetical protein
MNYEVNKEIIVRYIAENKISGLTDLNIKIYNPQKHLVYDSTMQEIGSGIYKFSFVPNINGIWKVTINSKSNGDSVQITYNVGNVDAGKRFI